MERIQFHDAHKCAQLDAPSVSTKENYAAKNEYAYYICINVWVGLVNSLDQQASDVLADRILAHGLIDTIKDCNASAFALIKSNPDMMSDFSRYLVRNLTISDALQVLRFAKRFSPQEADLVERQSLTKFKNILNEVKMKSRVERNQWLITSIRPIVHDICRGWVDTDLAIDGYFSSGAVQNTKKCLGAKASSWLFPYFLDMRYPLSDRNAYYAPEFPDNPHHYNFPGWLPYNLRTAEAKPVPKSFESARIIAEEESTRQWHLQAIRSRLEKCIQANGYSGHIGLQDQGINQLRAFLGSTNPDTFCTIDLSSASDRLSYSLFAELFPQNVVNSVREWRSSTVCVDGKVYTASMCATSGSAICFVIESIVFYSIARFASELNGEEDMAYAYGDDIIVGAKSYPTTCEMLEALGFVVNEDKSFCPPSQYRESCGVEFMAGADCSTIYFPRKPIKRDVSSIESLTKLHNRLYDVWPVHSFLKGELRKLVGPNFTTSSTSRFVEGFPSDIWDPIPEVKHLPERYDRRDDNEHLCDAHYTVREKPDKTGHPYKVPEMYYYVMYLLHGPQYDDALSELLHVSTSRVKVEDCYNGTLATIGLEKDI